MATPLRQPSAPPAFPNANDFLELYAFERPGAAIPVDEFVEELKALVREHPIEAVATEAQRAGRRAGQTGGRGENPHCPLYLPRGRLLY
jgi:hypothetical protein